MDVAGGKRLVDDFLDDRHEVNAESGSDQEEARRPDGRGGELRLTLDQRSKGSGRKY
jgi:hypothetical protein